MSARNSFKSVSVLSITCFSLVVSGAISGCKAGGSAATSTTDTTTTGGGGGGGNGGGGTTTPTNGMSCASGTLNSADNLSSYPVSYIAPGTMNGTSISSVTVYAQTSDSGATAGQTDAGALTLNVYTCGTTSSIGSSQATLGPVSIALAYDDLKPVTFTLGSPFTIPTNCANGDDPISFKITGSQSGAGVIQLAETAPSTSCFLQESSSSTADVYVGKTFMATIVAN